MAKIPGTHRHASIASIPHSKEYKEGWDQTFDEEKAARNSTLCQTMTSSRHGLLWCNLPKNHAGPHKWGKAE